MTRRKFVYDPETKDLVEVTRGPPPAVAAPAVHGNFAPVDVAGVVLDDRGKLRRYLKQNDLVPYEDARGVAERARREKARREAADRKQGLIDAYERTRDAERARKRFG